MTTPFTPPESPHLANTDGRFQLSDHVTSLDEAPGKKTAKRRLEDAVERIADEQRKLYAQNNWALLLVFQAMDAAGKDSTIRNVLSGVNPAGCSVTSFKRPSSRELNHDFLWRTTQALLQRGMIGVFNRSHYEEVLVVRVHPEILDHQRLPFRPVEKQLWPERMASIRDHEQHLARNGTAILKFFLNVSREEQRQRFLARLEQPHKRWKFEANDVRERGYWDSYMDAYEAAIRETSRPWAPWYSIPADNKPVMRYLVAELIADALESLSLNYPSTGASDQALHDELHERLKNETLRD
ncbi:MAG: PPK2 family polyphosphate kinase [Planctomycetota bacterium]